MVLGLGVAVCVLIGDSELVAVEALLPVDDAESVLLTEGVCDGVGEGDTANEDAWDRLGVCVKVPLQLPLFEPDMLVEGVGEGVRDCVGVELALPVAEWLVLCVSVSDDEQLLVWELEAVPLNDDVPVPLGVPSMDVVAELERVSR